MSPMLALTIENEAGFPGDRNDDLEQVEPTEIANAQPATMKNSQKSLVIDNRSSLNSIYGTRIGLLQSLSMILNTGLMIYSHVGLSAVFLSNQQRISDAVSASTNNNPSSNNSSTSNSSLNLTGICNEADYAIWDKGGGALNKSKEQNYCARQYGGSGCLLTDTCNVECFTSVFGYSTECAACFAAVPRCSLLEGCAFLCQDQDGQSPECQACILPCNNKFEECAGLSLALAIANQTDLLESPTVSPVSVENATENSQNAGAVCERQQQGVDYKSVDEYYTVWEVMFLDSIRVAWKGNAKLLALIVVVFSGIWPYAKNVILMLTWYLPLHGKQRSSVLTWLRRLGKYTLVDIYVRTNPNMVRYFPMCVTVAEAPSSSFSGDNSSNGRSDIRN
jgi:hypothetical protein